MKILVAESDPQQRRMLKELLSAAGHKVEISTDGMAASVKLISVRGKYDLLLTAVRMPCISGQELLEDLKIRKSSVKVIGMADDDGPANDFPHFWNRKTNPAKLVSLINKIAKGL